MRNQHLIIVLLFASASFGISDTQPLPDLTGPYATGTVSRHLIDTSRENPFGDDPSYRELMVQIWYPAESVQSADSVVYMPNADVIGPMARSIHFPFPQEMEDYYLTLASHSVLDAPLSNAEPNYPVLIFSHGSSAMKTQNVYQMEELASHGFVVAAIAHTYNSLAVRFSDNRVVDWVSDSTTIPDVFDRHTDDVRFVMDRLVSWNEDDLMGVFTGRLDLSRAGVFGMSIGGVAAARTLIYDSRFKAGINMDGTLCYIDVPGVTDYTEICDTVIEKPFMIMLHDGHVLADEHTYPETLLQAGGVVYTISDTDHFDFTELPMVWTLTGLDGVYPAAQSSDPVRVVRIFTDYAIAFFNQYLNGMEEPLLQGPSVLYPEVTIEVYEDQRTSFIATFELYK